MPNPYFELFDQIFSVLSLVGLLLFVFRIKAFSAIFWKICFFVLIIAELSYDIYLNPIVVGTSLLDIAALFIAFSLIFPLYLALYLYAFKFLEEKQE